MPSSQGRDTHHHYGGDQNLTVGQILRRTRIHYGLNLADLELALRIKQGLLFAIEEGRYDQLPGRVYAIGFVRTYSEYLGLDGDKMVTLFKKQSTGSTEKPELSMPAAASESKLPNVYILGSSAAAVLAIIIAVVIFSSGSGNQSIPDAPAVNTEAQALLRVEPETTAAALAAIAPSSGGTAPLTAALPADAVLAAKDQLAIKTVIKVTDNVWVEIRDAKGKALLSRILQPGDEYTLPDQKGLVMDTGNAGAIDITVNGMPVPKLGEKGDIKRKIPLDPQAFLESAKQKAAAAIAPAASGSAEIKPVIRRNSP